MSDDILTTSYLQILLESIAENIRNGSADSSSIDEIKKYVRKMIHSHVNPISESTLVPMDLGNMETKEEPQNDAVPAGAQAADIPDSTYADMLASMLKGGGKDSGGKGKGFQGKCFFCGEEGHSKVYYHKLDKSMGDLGAKGYKGSNTVGGKDRWNGGRKYQFNGGNKEGGWQQGGGYSNYPPPQKGKGTGRGKSWNQTCTASTSSTTVVPPATRWVHPGLRRVSTSI